MKLSVIIPAYNEEQNIENCIDELTAVVRDVHGIELEVIVVNDNSSDRTQEVVEGLMLANANLKLVKRDPPGGFGRAIRTGLQHVTGEAVVIYMADLSDDPEDVVHYYRKLAEGYDCVFGSRFIKHGVVREYPKVKLIINRIVNRCIQLMFWTKFNDLTNAFKAYRMDVIRDCGPFRASHFNITLEMSLSVLCRNYNVTQIPIRWYGRSWGSSNLRLREMGRRYLCTLLMMFFQRMLIADDLLAETLSAKQFEKSRKHKDSAIAEIDKRLSRLENLLGSKEVVPRSTSHTPVNVPVTTNTNGARLS